MIQNSVRMRRRAASRAVRRESVAAARDRIPPTDELVERIETQRLLAREVLALPEPFRTAIILRYFDERRAADIARQQGVSDATVRGRIRRGLEILREQLD